MEEYISEHIDVVSKIEYEPIQKTVDYIVKALENGNKIFIFGNGGSAADAQHFAAEMAGRFKMERDALQFIALTTNTSIITAIANDYSFDYIFSRQIEGLAIDGDIAIGISTSGNSLNVKIGLETAQQMGCNTIAFLGESEGIIGPICNYIIQVPSKNTARIQEAHILIIHMICEEVEKKLFGEVE